MKNTILKSMLAMGIIAVAASMLAVSCGKVAGGGNNNNANNSGSGNSGGSGNDGGGGNAGCTGICPTTNLVLEPTNPSPAYVKINGNTVIINAAGWSADVSPRSDANDNNRGFDDAGTGGSSRAVFNIKYPGAIPNTSAGLYFVNRAHVTKDNIAMQAATTSCSSSESADNIFATSAGGSTCRNYAIGNVSMSFSSYLGTVFNNTKTGSHARGSMQCSVPAKRYDTVSGADETMSDTTILNQPSGLICYIAMLNNAGTAATADIDDAWVGDAASTTEVELYALGIDVTGKTISQFSSAAGYNLAEFIKPHDNAAFKRLLQNNPWGELKFKVRIVTSTTFAAL